MIRGLSRRWRLGSRTGARTPGRVDREDSVSIIADHDVVEVAMNGLLLWGLVLPILLVVAGVVTVLRRNGRR
jgi:hypothetical protein